MPLQASSKVKGITIEIGADTTSFGYAMRQIRSEATTVSKDLKTIDNALKLDPSNVEKAADKLKLLRESAENASKKVDTIKKAIDSLNKEFSDKSSKEYTDQLSYLERQLESASREQEVANARLKDFEQNAESAGQSVLKLSDFIKSNLIADFIRSGLRAIADLIGDIIRKAVEAAKALAGFSLDAIKSAAELQDAYGYSETVYGDASDKALQWAKDNSEGLRISEKQLTQYMNTLGQVFHSQGIESEDALSMTENLMGLTADIRAAMGKSTDDILPTMMRGFTTSVKNFRQFGVVMTDAEVKAYALANGLVDLAVNEEDVEKATVKLHSAQEKVQKLMNQGKEGTAEFEKAELALAEAEAKLEEALGGEAEEMDAGVIVTARYMLLMERLKNIIGQNEKESGLFNSQLELTKTKFANLKDTIGLELLPVATDLITAFNDFLSSEEGKALLNQIVEKFKEWAKAIEDMIKDGKFTDFIQNIIDNAPKVVEAIGDVVNGFIEALPHVTKLIDEVLRFFGIKTENQKIKEAFIEVEDEIKKFAEQSGTDIDTMIEAINKYAEQNNIDVLAIYSDWSTYQPKVSGYIAQITTDANGGKTSLEEALAGMDSSTSAHIESQISNWERLRLKIEEVKNFFDSVSSITDYVNITPGSGLSGYAHSIGYGVKSIGNLWNYITHAEGGPEYPGQVYRINDDAGHRPELFIPSVAGYRLNGDQTEKVLNNINNSRNFSGGVNVYVTSYGTNASAIANEIGAEVNKKLRMSGAML